MAILRSVFLLTAFCFWLSNACTCKEDLSREGKFKKAEWVSYVKILSREENRKEHIVIYHVDHLQVYKPFELGHKNGKGNNSTLNCEIHTQNTDSLCGIPNLKVGDYYLLSGAFDSISNATLYLNLCHSEHSPVLNTQPDPSFLINPETNETKRFSNDEALQSLLAKRKEFESKEEFVLVGEKMFKENSTELADVLSDLKTISVEVNETAIVANVTTAN